MKNRWSMEEEYVLATIWLEVHDSTDVVNERSFWNEVTKRFNNQSDGPHRNKNSITALWSRMNVECRNYNAIYKELLRTSDDPCRLSNANRIYYERYGRGIKYQHVWFALRNTLAWDRDDE
jgi:hypothetical protein